MEMIRFRMPTTKMDAVLLRRLGVFIRKVRKITRSGTFVLFN